jgi:Ca2+-binding EF-hand superfamily protein
LIEFGKNEEEIENLKEKLCRDMSLNLPNFFRIFDSDQSGDITMREFIDGCRREFEVVFSLEEGVVLFQ